MEEKTSTNYFNILALFQHEVHMQHRVTIARLDNTGTPQHYVTMDNAEILEHWNTGALNNTGTPGYTRILHNAGQLEN
ncbi:hypothetical protein Glove_365g225 [Diversispora epigaea]|uniref:Uncharacterized protein n=1 Tax=Diversispora epigaea TaxID=1348612 RepID=A0A397H8Q6_9GLOM|nr:hypothetical protein Glove_365g225 [Diversispora epigaea]